MSVQRLSKDALQMILKGQVKEDATCVVKFYSNSCHLCHGLSEYYSGISDNEKYSRLKFFAFNVDDYPQIEKIMKFTGVPSIFVIRTNIGNRRPVMRLLPEPDNPNDNTWYRVREITQFIDREAL
jgi:thiol-disulfide isomerase/thioredoxin